MASFLKCPSYYRARIFRAQGDITMAIVNYTQAIKLDKTDYESFFQRAEMYEKVSMSFSKFTEFTIC